MFRGRGRGGRGGRGGKFSGPKPLKGLFVDGQWQCNCSPRLPAEHFKVRKESPNQGRWFYTCQKPDGQRCDFFLWDDDAKPREESAILNNSRTEPQAAAAAGLADNGRSKHSPPPPYTVQANKTKAEGYHVDSETEGEEEEIFPWPLTGEEEQQLVRKADAVSPPPITPKKRAINHGLATPVTGNGKRKADDHLSEWHAAGLQPPTSAKRLNTGAATPQTTPTPGRFRDALATSESAIDLELEVMNTLNIHNVRLESDVRSNLRDSLSRVNLRVQGIVRGRDVSRLQIKAKDAKIAEQQLRITTLEAELEVERAMVQHLRWERQSGVDVG